MDISSVYQCIYLKQQNLNILVKEHMAKAQVEDFTPKGEPLDVGGLHAFWQP